LIAVRWHLLRRLCAVGGINVQIQNTDYGEIADGYPMQSPYLAIANRQAELMMRIASEFGFTPASRSRYQRRHPISCRSGPDSP